MEGPAGRINFGFCGAAFFMDEIQQFARVRQINVRVDRMVLLEVFSILISIGDNQGSRAVFGLIDDVDPG